MPESWRRGQPLPNPDYVNQEGSVAAAVALEWTGLKDLILRNALTATDAVSEKAERISLDAEQTRFIIDLLDNPPTPNARLVTAAKSFAARQALDDDGSARHRS